MTALKRLAYACVAVAVVLLVAGTGGFSAIQADRTSNIGVTDDEHAPLGIEVWDSEDEIEVGEPFHLDVSDNSGTDIEIERVVPKTDDIVVSQSGTGTPQNLQIMCTEPHRDRITVQIVASSSEMRIDKTKVIDSIDCVQREESGGNNPGNSSELPYTFHGCDRATFKQGLSPNDRLYFHNGEYFSDMTADAAEANGLLNQNKTEVTVTGDRRITRIEITATSEEHYNTNDCSPWGDLDN